MADNVIVEIDGVGPVLFERSKRARRVVISVRPFKGVRVAVPCSASFRAAEKFVYSKSAWIKKQLNKMEQYEEKYNSNTVNSNHIDKAEAKVILAKRLDQLALKHGFSYNKVSVRNQKTRWGSCSAKNNISLNMKLVNLPCELMDYVILHELVHTVIKNHSKEFWKELDKFVPNSKQVSSCIRRYGIELY